VADWRLTPPPSAEGPTADLVAYALLAIAYELRTANMIKSAEVFGGLSEPIEERLGFPFDTPER
jgi:hypothetical protein